MLQSMGDCEELGHDWATEQQIGTSMVVQWLRLQAPNAAGLGSVPGQGTRSHKPQLRPGTAKEINIFKNWKKW